MFSIFNIVGKRYVYFTVSAIIICAGIAAMVYSTLTIGSPVRLSIDYTGGSFMELRFEQPVSAGDVRDVFAGQGFSDASVQTTGDGSTVIIRTKNLDNLAKSSVQGCTDGPSWPFYGVAL